MRKDEGEMLEEQYGAVMAMLAERRAASEAERFATLAVRARRERAIAERARALAARVAEAPRTILSSLEAADRTGRPSTRASEAQGDCPTVRRAA
jgi:hypothetical protein